MGNISDLVTSMAKLDWMTSWAVAVLCISVNLLLPHKTWFNIAVGIWFIKIVLTNWHTSIKKLCYSILQIVGIWSHYINAWMGLLAYHITYIVHLPLSSGRTDNAYAVYQDITTHRNISINIISTEYNPFKNINWTIQCNKFFLYHQ